MDEETKKKMEEELDELFKEMFERREIIRKEWWAERGGIENIGNKIIRGKIATPEMKALEAEEKQRRREILAKYKDK